MTSIDQLFDLFVLTMQQNPMLVALLVILVFASSVYDKYLDHQKTVVLVKGYKDSTEQEFDRLESMVGPLIARINRLADRVEDLTKKIP